MDVAIIDYGLGNVESLQKALKHIGKSCIITKDKNQIYKSDHMLYNYTYTTYTMYFQINYIKITLKLYHLRIYKHVQYLFYH